MGVQGSSPGNTATPPAASAPNTVPFSRAVASGPSMNSWCSRWALSTSATDGCVMVARPAISPGWFMPISTTPIRWASLRRSNVSGTPMSLLKLPRVAKAASAPRCATRMAAIISLAVVLPLLPVTAISGHSKRRRQPPASAPSARRVSGTHSVGTRTRSGNTSVSTAAAPASMAASMKAWPSKRSPRSAMYRSPGRTVRESVEMPVKRSAPLPNIVTLGSHW